MLQDLCTQRDKFKKPAEVYSSLTTFGPNIIASEGEMWKKYHRVSRPAFNERNHELVWNETFKIVNRLFEEDALWKDKECVECDQVLEVTLGVSVMVINFKSTINDLSRLLWKFWERQVGLPIKINISLANLLHWQRLASRMEPQPKSWKDMRCRLLRHSRLYLQIRSFTLL